jgi:hypothetical protein
MSFRDALRIVGSVFVADLVCDDVAADQLALVPDPVEDGALTIWHEAMRRTSELSSQARRDTARGISSAGNRARRAIGDQR